MAELQALRIRLNFIRAYLYTCSPKSMEELQCLFFGKEYLYEHIHQYSIGDLSMIQRGTLYQELQKAFKKGEAHILKCPLCSLKGFICEICNGSRILYPFHIETTFRVSTHSFIINYNYIFIPFFIIIVLHMWFCFPRRMLKRQAALSQM